MFKQINPQCNEHEWASLYDVNSNKLSQTGPKQHDCAKHSLRLLDCVRHADKCAAEQGVRPTWPHL